MCIGLPVGCLCVYLFFGDEKRQATNWRWKMCVCVWCVCLQAQRSNERACTTCSSPSLRSLALSRALCLSLSSLLKSRSSLGWNGEWNSKNGRAHGGVVGESQKDAGSLSEAAAGTPNISTEIDGWTESPALLPHTRLSPVSGPVSFSLISVKLSLERLEHRHCTCSTV